ncbi:GNAT family N-acetyltransferase [Fluviispira vulneris]|uniref:GNAT family N-acetyltransferase n=1 Tax=Fluviispira vulneris TaxID=2763012 RepID=UPI001647C19D|nr:GNAT family N-acetyltransferase [Fluviispira vulneris]
MKDTDFNFCILNDEYFNQAKFCLIKVFIENEPMGKHLKLSEDDLTEFVEGLLIHAFPQKLSWIAIDNTTNKIAAVRILTDVYNDYSPVIHSSKKLNIIFNFLESLYSNHEKVLQVKKTTLLHTWMTAVAEEHQQKGLLKTLFKHGAHWAKKQGFQYCIGEATNIHNLNFLKKYTEFSQLNAIEYKKFEFNNSYPFQNLEEHLEGVLYYYPLQYFPEIEKDMPAMY